MYSFRLFLLLNKTTKGSSCEGYKKEYVKNCNKQQVFATYIYMKSSSEESFVKQLKDNQNIIHKICRLYTSDEDAHNDLFQEITIQLWKAYGQFRGDSKFTTWAYRVVLILPLHFIEKRNEALKQLLLMPNFIV